MKNTLIVITSQDFDSDASFTLLLESTYDLDNFQAVFKSQLHEFCQQRQVLSQRVNALSNVVCAFDIDDDLTPEQQHAADEFSNAHDQYTQYCQMFGSFQHNGYTINMNDLIANEGTIHECLRAFSIQTLDEWVAQKLQAQKTMPL